MAEFYQFGPVVLELTPDDALLLLSQARDPHH